MENINSAEQMGALSTQAVSNMSADQLGGIAPEVIAGMTAEQMSAMPPEAMAGMSAQMMKAMSPEAMDGMSAPIKHMMDKLAKLQLENFGVYGESLSKLPTDTTKDALLAPDIVEQALTAADLEGLPNKAGITEGHGIWDSSATTENSSLEGVTPMETNVTSVNIETDVDLTVSGIIPAENQSLDSKFDSALASMDNVTAKDISETIDTTQMDTADTPKEDTSNDDTI